MPKKINEDKKLEAIQKLKAKIATEANEIMLKAFKATQKELNNLLKSNELWYFDGDMIKDHDEFHTTSDRNVDQMIIDHFTVIHEEAFKHVIPDHLWTNEDINK